tara:strand:- start:77 stop:649 length:573 start_codon:yes stop_codon:yes gene_type:complete
MKKKIIVIIFLLTFVSIIGFLLSTNFFKDKKKEPINNEEEKLNTYNTNIIKDVHYESKDAKGNEYVIDASIGEIDLENSNIIFLENVRAVIRLNNSNDITITSDYGKYNSNNYDTIFSKNVIINYLDNKITGEYLDFSISRNNMIISRNVIYNNKENVLTADVIEVNIQTKDTKIFMYEKDKKINIKSIN